LPSFSDRAFFAALEDRRRSEDLSWRELGRRLELSPSTFSRLSRGRRPDVETFIKLIAWLNISPDAFITGLTEEGEAQDPMVSISSVLRADPKLSPEAAGAIEELVRLAYNRLREPK
jgi:transcriptional regulator with XRE-family HTH domain